MTKHDIITPIKRNMNYTRYMIPYITYFMHQSKGEEVRGGTAGEPHFDILDNLK